MHSHQSSRRLKSALLSSSSILQISSYKSSISSALTPPQKERKKRKGKRKGERKGHHTEDRDVHPQAGGIVNNTSIFM